MSSLQVGSVMTAEPTRESIAAFVRGPSQRLSSSIGLGWKNIAVERHLIERSEKPETDISHYIITLAPGPHVLAGRRAGPNRRLTRYLKPPGTMNVNLDGLVPAVYPSTQTDLIVCALNPASVEEIAADRESGSASKLRERRDFRDKPLSSLIRLIEQEAQSSGASGRLYIDHLTYALTLRLLALDARRDDGFTLSNSLSHRRLKRVVERMEADLGTDLDLKTLAVESGYSISHFLRMFQAAMGCTPFRYLSQLRVKRAQVMMSNKSLRLIDVALECGFSSHSQLSRVFRQIIGVTPSEYRRNI